MHRFAHVLFALFIHTSLSAAEKNILFIITDDQSPTLGCYGDEAAHTPAIDAVAADGMVFTHAFATTASCSASRSVILSGLHNHLNGQYGHEHHYHGFESFEHVVSASLSHNLQKNRYRTARIGKYHVAPDVVYHFDNVLKGSSREPVTMAENCRDFLSEKSNDPFFLYYALSDPHRGGGVNKNAKSALKPDLFGNLPDKGQRQGIEEKFYTPDEVTIPHFLTDTQETREELAEYYQSVARIDQGVARLVEILKENDLYDKTLIVFTSDHGMAFAGGKTTVYEGGLHVPFVVRDPYSKERGITSDALISHVDITPSLLDYAGLLDRDKNRPKDVTKAGQHFRKIGHTPARNMGEPFHAYYGHSWLPVLRGTASASRDIIYASHTFHEIQMYYPMRVVRDREYKLIWNIAHQLPYPFASDLWRASSWQAQLQKSKEAPYGQKTVGAYVDRPEFELFAINTDPFESKNLAYDPEYADVLKAYQQKLKRFQKENGDPWVLKWEYE